MAHPRQTPDERWRELPPDTRVAMGRLPGTVLARGEDLYGKYAIVKLDAERPAYWFRQQSLLTLDPVPVLVPA